MSKVLKTLAPILGKLVLMVGSGIITLYAMILLLFELGVAKRLDGTLTGWVVLCGAAAIGFLAPRLVVWLLHKTGYKRPWIIVATLELMVVSAVVTFAMLCFTYWKLLSGHYHPALNWGLWGLTAIGFLAPGVIVWYLQKGGNKRAWIILATLALMVVAGVFTCAVLLHVFSQPPPPPPLTAPVPAMTPGITVFHVMDQQDSTTEILGTPNALTSIGLLTAKCIIWSDIYGESCYEPKGYRCSGSHIASDGRRLDWQCETKDGRTFTQIVLASKTYDFSKGRLFLVSAKRRHNQGPAA